MFELYGQEHTVFSTSNECYGLRESMERYLVLMMKGNPTFPTKKSEIIFTHCTDVTEPTLAAAIDQLEDDFEFEWVPSYDEAECNEVVGRLLDTTSCQDVFDASSDSCFDLKTPVKGSSVGHFYGMASYFWEFAKILGIEQVATLAEAQGRIDKVCSATKDEMETSCFKVTYIMKMLLEGYDLTRQLFHKLTLSRK